jgi:hypothetical protein
VHGCVRTGGQGEKSGVNREVHAPFRGSPGVRSPGRPDYAFDAWMAREFPTVPFERYADDAVVHCKSERQARHMR